MTDETEVKIIRLSKIAFQMRVAISFHNLTEIIFHNNWFAAEHLKNHSLFMEPVST